MVQPLLPELSGRPLGPRHGGLLLGVDPGVVGLPLGLVVVALQLDGLVLGERGSGEGGLQVGPGLGACGTNSLVAGGGVDTLAIPGPRAIHLLRIRRLK